MERMVGVTSGRVQKNRKRSHPATQHIHAYSRFFALVRNCIGVALFSTAVFAAWGRMVNMPRSPSRCARDLVHKSSTRLGAHLGHPGIGIQAPQDTWPPGRHRLPRGWERASVIQASRGTP